MNMNRLSSNQLKLHEIQTKAIITKREASITKKTTFTENNNNITPNEAQNSLPLAKQNTDNYSEQQINFISQYRRRYWRKKEKLHQNIQKSLFQDFLSPETPLSIRSPSSSSDSTSSPSSHNTTKQNQSLPNIRMVLREKGTFIHQLNAQEGRQAAEDLIPVTAGAMLEASPLFQYSAQTIQDKEKEWCLYIKTHYSISGYYNIDWQERRDVLLSFFISDPLVSNVADQYTTNEETLPTNKYCVLDPNTHKNYLVVSFFELDAMMNLRKMRELPLLDNAYIENYSQNYESILPAFYQNQHRIELLMDINYWRQHSIEQLTTENVYSTVLLQLVIPFNHVVNMDVSVLKHTIKDFFLEVLLSHIPQFSNEQVLSCDVYHCAPLTNNEGTESVDTGIEDVYKSNSEKEEHYDEIGDTMRLLEMESSMESAAVIIDLILSNYVQALDMIRLFQSISQDTTYMPIIKNIFKTTLIAPLIHFVDFYSTTAHKRDTFEFALPLPIYLFETWLNNNMKMKEIATQNELLNIPINQVKKDKMTLKKPPPVSNESKIINNKATEISGKAGNIIKKASVQSSNTLNKPPPKKSISPIIEPPNKESKMNVGIANEVKEEVKSNRSIPPPSLAPIPSAINRKTINIPNKITAINENMNEKKVMKRNEDEKSREERLEMPEDHSDKNRKAEEDNERRLKVSTVEENHKANFDAVIQVTGKEKKDKQEEKKSSWLDSILNMMNSKNQGKSLPKRGMKLSNRQMEAPDVRILSYTTENKKTDQLKQDPVAGTDTFDDSLERSDTSLLIPATVNGKTIEKIKESNILAKIVPMHGESATESVDEEKESRLKYHQLMVRLLKEHEQMKSDLNYFLNMLEKKTEGDQYTLIDLMNIKEKDLTAKKTQTRKMTQQNSNNNTILANDARGKAQTEIPIEESHIHLEEKKFQQEKPISLIKNEISSKQDVILDSDDEQKTMNWLDIYNEIKNLDAEADSMNGSALRDMTGHVNDDEPLNASIESFYKQAF